MLRHEFQPGKLVAGVFLLGAAIVFGGDAAGGWDVPWFAMVPIVVGGLFLAGATGTVTYAVQHWYRSRRGADPIGGGTGTGTETGAGTGAGTGRQA